MANVLFSVYVIIGICLSLYWWNKDYKKDYDSAKDSVEGVEDGMAVLILLCFMFFWPIVLTFKFIKNVIKLSK